MADHSDHVANLKAVRDALVARRRSEARAAASIRADSGNDPDSDFGSNWGPAIEKLQQQIAAVEDAIRSEEDTARRALQEANAIRPGFQTQVGRPRGDVA